MKISCDVIRDLLPLYVEDMLSNDSKNIVDEHIEQCESCRDELKKLSEDVNHHYIYVYEDEELQTVVGFVHAEVYESLYSFAGLNILGLAVLPEFQGKGIGKELMNYLELNAKNNSIEFIRLNSADYRVEAHKFYENIGYVCDKTQKRFMKRLD